MKKNGAHVKPRKREFSKVITAIGLSLWVFVILFAIVMMMVTRDLSPITWVLGSVDAVVASITGFYFTKAAKENQIKLRSIYGDLARENDTYNKYMYTNTVPVGYETWGK